MKKILAFVLAMLMVLPLVSCATNTTPKATSSATVSATPEATTGAHEETPAPEEKVLDVYLIAGQSNAGGSTAISSKDAIFAFAPELRYGFSNVHYAGAIPSESAPRNVSWKKTTYGLGRSPDHIGPEAGMAKALSVYYNEETGRNAGIIKYALGGTSLLNNWKNSANWVSPSYKATLPAADITTHTGELYRGLLRQIEKNISEIYEYGEYTTVRICGFYWMQGCADRNYPEEYRKAFNYFAKDVRKDVSEIMKKYTGTDDDCGAAEMPIIVGTISQTYELNGPTVEQTNIKFIEMQKQFEFIIPNCYVVDNSGYKVSAWVNGQLVVLGSDKYHWSQADVLTIGENVGKVMLYCAGVTDEDPFPNRNN